LQQCYALDMRQSGFVVSMTRANRVNKLPEVFQVQHNSCTHLGHHIRQRIIVPIGVAAHQTKLYTDSIVLFAQQVVISDRPYLFAPMPDDGDFAVSRRDDWRKLSSCNAGSWMMLEVVDSLKARCLHVCQLGGFSAPAQRLNPLGAVTWPRRMPECRHVAIEGAGCDATR